MSLQKSNLEWDISWLPAISSGGAGLEDVIPRITRVQRRFLIAAVSKLLPALQLCAKGVEQRDDDGSSRKPFSSHRVLTLLGRCLLLLSEVCVCSCAHLVPPLYERCAVVQERLALECWRQALAVATVIGDVGMEMEALEMIGSTQSAMACFKVCSGTLG